MVGYQIQIVGIDNIPTRHIRDGWSFIDAYVDKLKRGQALRIILPKGTSTSGIFARWKRLSGERVKYASKAQPNGSVKVWLWLKDKNSANL